MLSRTISGVISLIHTTVISEIPSIALIEIPQTPSTLCPSSLLSYSSSEARVDLFNWAETPKQSPEWRTISDNFCFRPSQGGNTVQ